MGMLFDGLLIIFWIRLTWVSGQQLNQNPQSLLIKEGEDVSMNCSSSSVFNMLLWYRQNAGKGLDHLITLYKGGDSVPKGNMIAKFGERRMDSLLSISTSAPEDSGTYFCAGTTQCDTSTCNLHSNLQLSPSHYAVSLCSCIGKTIWS